MALDKLIEEGPEEVIETKDDPPLPTKKPATENISTASGSIDDEEVSSKGKSKSATPKDDIVMAPKSAEAVNAVEAAEHNNTVTSAKTSKSEDKGKKGKGKGKWGAREASSVTADESHMEKPMKEEVQKAAPAASGWGERPAWGKGRKNEGAGWGKAEQKIEEWTPNDGGSPAQRMDAVSPESNQGSAPYAHSQNQSQNQVQNQNQSHFANDVHAQKAAQDEALSGWDSLMTSVPTTQGTGNTSAVTSGTTSNTTTVTPQQASATNNNAAHAQMQSQSQQTQSQVVGSATMGGDNNHHQQSVAPQQNGQMSNGQIGGGFNAGNANANGNIQQQPGNANMMGNNMGGMHQNNMHQQGVGMDYNQNQGYQNQYGQQQQTQQGQFGYQSQYNQQQQQSNFYQGQQQQQYNGQQQQYGQQQQNNQVAQQQQQQGQGNMNANQNQSNSASEQSAETKVLITPCQAYTPENNFNTTQQFLKINEDLQQAIEVILYNSNNSGWSFGRCLQSQQQGWFPTSCCQFDVVTTMYAFDTKPENTRQYIQFQPNQRIVIEKRHECGWWIGSLIENEQHGNLGPKGYFPGNYCTPLESQG